MSCSEPNLLAGGMFLVRSARQMNEIMMIVEAKKGGRVGEWFTPGRWQVGRDAGAWRTRDAGRVDDCEESARTRRDQR